MLLNTMAECFIPSFDITAQTIQYVLQCKSYDFYKLTTPSGPGWGQNDAVISVDSYNAAILFQFTLDIFYAPTSFYLINPNSLPITIPLSNGSQTVMIQLTPQNSKLIFYSNYLGTIGNNKIGSFGLAIIN